MFNLKLIIMKKCLLLIAGFMLLCATTAFAGTGGCSGKYLTNGANTIEIIPTIENGAFYFTIQGSGLSWMGGTFVEINGVGGNDIRNLISKATSTEIKIGPMGNAATDTKKPRIYTPVYVLMPGEVNFGNVEFADSDWCEPSSIGINPSKIKFGNTGEKQTITVTGTKLEEEISIEFDETKVFILNTTLPAEGGEVEIECVSTEEFSNSTISFESGMISAEAKASLAFAVPELSVSPTSFKFTPESGNTKVFTLSTKNLSAGVTIESNSPNFTVSPSEITDITATSTQITVTCTASERESAEITFSTEDVTYGTGVISKTATVAYSNNTACEGVCTDKYPGDAGIAPFVKGCGYKFVTNTDNSITVTFELLEDDGEISAGYLWTRAGWSQLPEKSMKISGNVATYTIPAADAGSITAISGKFGTTAGPWYQTDFLNYTRGTVCKPTISVNPTSLTFVPGDAPKTISVSAQKLSGAITITSSSENFTVEPATIAAGATFPVQVTVSCIATTNEAASLEFATEGGESVYVDVEYIASPIIMLDPEEIAFDTKTTEAVINVTLANLLGDVTVESSNPDAFAIDVTSISQGETSAVVTVTRLTNETEEAVITFTTTDGESGSIEAEANVSYRKPEVMTILSNSKFEGAGAWIYIDGYGEKYEKDNSKYTVTAKSTNAMLNTVRNFNCDGDKFYVIFNAAPGAADITTISITYANGDYGSASFKGSVLTIPSISVSPESLSFAEAEAQTVTVTGVALGTDITITSSSDKFTVSPATITAAPNLSATVSVECVDYELGLSETITFTSGDIVVTLPVVTATPAPQMTVTPESITFYEAEDGIITVEARYLEEDITIESSSAQFTLSETTISKDATFPYQITVTNTAAEEGDGSITFTTGDIVALTTVKCIPNTNCSGFSKEKSEGQDFINGYNYNFESLDNGDETADVTIQFELLDDRTGLVVYLEGVDGEKGMANLYDKVYAITLAGRSINEVLNFSCKFAFAGGMSVTKAFTYTVGDNCEPGCGLDTPPVINTLAESEIGSDYAKLSVSATDEEGADVTLFIVSSASFDEQVLESENGILTIENLEPETEYTVDVYAMDRCDNVSDPSSITFTTDVATEAPGTNADTSDTYKLFENNIKQVVIVTEENVYKLSGQELK